MAEKWYPVVDIVSCIECGTCIEFCPTEFLTRQRPRFRRLFCRQAAWIYATGAETGVPWEQSPMQETQQGGFRRYLG